MGSVEREPLLCPGYVQPRSTRPITSSPPTFHPVSVGRHSGGLPGSNYQDSRRPLNDEDLGGPLASNHQDSCTKCQSDRVHCVLNGLERCAHCSRWNYSCLFKKIPGCTNCYYGGLACVQDIRSKQDPYGKCVLCSQRNFKCGTI